MLKYSTAVSKFLEDKPDCFKLAKELAVFNNTGKYFQRECQSFFNALEARGLVTLEMCWGNCVRGSERNLVFLGDETFVLAQLAELKPKETKHVPTPTTVLIKMVALRLSKLHEVIEQENKSIAASNTYAQTNPQPGYARPIQPLVPEIEFADMADGFKRFSGSYWTRKVINDFNEVLARPEITPDIALKAWDVYSVKVVMTT